MHELQQTMDAAEFMEHWVDYLIEPWGEGRADLRMGILAATIANTQRGEDSSPFTPGDFMPDFTKHESAETFDRDQAILEQQAMFEWMTLSTGGTVLNGDAA